MRRGVDREVIAANPLGEAEVESSLLREIEAAVRGAIADQPDPAAKRKGRRPTSLALIAVACVLLTAVAVGTHRGPAVAVADGIVSWVEEVVYSDNGNPIPVRTVQTPTGPLRVPALPSGTTKAADGSVHEWQINLCGWSGEAHSEAYTRAELLAAPENWCFHEPGTIPTTTTAAAPPAQRQSRKSR